MVLGPFGYFLTLFAVWAAINAFNMVDGIDGLLGGLSCVSFAAIGMILWFDGQTSLAIWCFAMIAAILPYIMLNLGIWVAATKSLWGCGQYADWFYRDLDPAQKRPGAKLIPSARLPLCGLSPFR